MFEHHNYPKSLPEEQFESWLEKGKSNLLGYKYLLIVWNMYEEDFQPVYLDQRDKIADYQTGIGAQEVLIAAYDIYSESRITLEL
jgi:hypothetical protein